MKARLHQAIHRIRTRIEEHYAKRRLMSECDLWRDLQHMIRHSSSTGASYFDHHLLFHHITAHAPHSVLELGSGISTVTLAHAAQKVRRTGKPCEVVSMEENAFYYDELRDLFPPHLKASVELILSPTQDREIPGDLIGRYYVDKPRRAYALVFIDGPQIPKMREDPRYFDADILDVLDWASGPVTAYLDHRQGTQVNLRRLYPDVPFHYNHRHHITTFRFPPRLPDGPTPAHPNREREARTIS